MAEVFIGQVMPVAFDFAPRGFATCSGQLLPITQNQALFALLGTQYGGNGTTAFALPDLRGRTPMGHDPQPIGAQGGAETVTLTPAQMPMHTHRAAGTPTAGSLSNPTGGLYGAATENLYATPGQQETLGAVISTVGDGQPHSNMQPYLALNFCIALQGIFPSRQ